MSSTTERTRKPRLTPEILENENVFFYDKVHSKEELLKWLQPIRHEMKRARTEIPECSRKQLKKEIDEFQYSGQDGETALASKWSLEPRHYHSEERFNKRISAAETEILNALDHCLEVREKAIALREDKVLEPRWTSLLKAEFFKPYAEVHDTKDKHSHEDYTWNGCPSRRALKNPVRTEPKPDLAYLFPIIDPACNMARVLHLDPRVENFTLPVLSELRKTKEIISSPTTTLLNRNPTKLGASDLACFPWAVIEVKRGTWKDDSAEFCYCQAANGSAEALIIREELAAKVRDPSNDALVIFSFTLLSPSSRPSAPPMSPADEEEEEEEEEEDEDEDEDEGVLEACESDADEDYVPSDDASGDDDGYTTVEEELYGTSEDEDEADEGYSSDRPFKALNQAEFLLRIRGRKSICC
ncbi:hypothetical protein ACET3X_001989 [Alternaria dauci]|uniref:Uncharacterized protein n=1 Tax=Alternaria dauci TaxID=48095 RepID=A0ABR3UZ86_9PLEO